MAVDKLAGTNNYAKILSSRVSLENTLTRFEETIAQNEPSVIRERLKRRLIEVRVNLNGRDNDDKSVA